MADLSDVENALVNEIVKALYPNGLTLVSAIGATCRVYRGWPAPAALNADLAGGIVNVTVFPSTHPEELLSPFLDVPSAKVTPPTLAVRVDGNVVTITGAAADNQLIGVLVDEVPYVYQVLGTDNCDGIAANLAAMLRPDRPVFLSYSTLTLPGARSLEARVVAKGAISRAGRRQCRDFQISCWCPSPLVRDEVGKIIDDCLMAQTFIDLSDGTKAHVRYASTQVFDQSQSALLYRRDINYKCQYTSIVRSLAPVMLFGEIAGSEGHSFS